MARPNLLLITVDQLRWDTYVQPFSLPALQLPNLRRLQREGTTLPHAYSNCPICMPTRMTWLYGLYASQVSSGLLSNDADWPTGLPSMGHALQAAGYHTALIGKLHSTGGLRHVDLLAEEVVTKNRGFDDVFEVSGKELAIWYDCRWTKHLREIGALDRYREETRRRCWAFDGEETGEPSFLAAEDTMDGFIGRHAADWLENYAGEKPFFLHASFCGPHSPFDPAAEYASRFPAEAMPPPEGEEDPQSLAMAQRKRAAYCGLIAQLDDEIGRLLDIVDRRGWQENTLVIFANDHGDMLGQHGCWSKGTPFDTSIRTPYIARWPGRIAAGKISDSMIEAVDLPCCLLDAAGLGGAIPDRLPGTPGRSFLPTLLGEEDVSAPRDAVYSEFGSIERSMGLGVWRLCRERDWKYVFRPGDGESLFHMASDPCEFHDVAAAPENRKHLDRLKTKLLAMMCRTAAAPKKQEH